MTGPMRDQPGGADDPHERRRHRLNRRMDSPDYRDEWYGEQCLHCRFYVPLDGPLGEDYGACTNAVSPFDGRVMFEHDGCEAFDAAGNEDATADDDTVDVTVPQEQLVQLARLLNLLVVSGDRQGTHFARERLDDLDREHGRWFREAGLWSQFSAARRDLHDLLAEDTAEADAKLDRELGELPYWRPPR
jgi:hypothetical protein